MGQPLANIHPDAKLAPGVVVEPFATVQGDVVIGEGSWIGPGAVINDGARIGKNVKIFSGAIISGIPQDLKFDGEQTTTEIGDNTVIREYATISRGTSDRMKTVIGQNCLIMGYVHIAHDCLIGDRVILVNSVQVAGHSVIGDWAILGGGSLIHQFSNIGAHSFVMGGSLLNKDVPPFAKSGRIPQSYCGVNSLGLRRRGFTAERVAEIHEIYRLLYNSGLKHSVALETIEAQVPQSPERDMVLNFIRSSKRGIMRYDGAGDAPDE